MSFGPSLREHWSLDPDLVYLNHGTVGATPRRVLAAQQRIRDEIERNPSRFLLRDLTAIGVGAEAPAVPRLRAAAGEVAAFLGVAGTDLVFTDNVTTSVNAVVRSLDLREGDEIMLTDHTYGAVGHAAAFAARRAGGVVRTLELPFPGHTPGLAPADFADAVVDAYREALGPRTRLAIVDHITSSSALVLPLARIAEVCRARGVEVLGDGAHAPGAIPVDIPALGVDWYGANLHKWAWAPRSCGILWAPASRQEGLHPPVISWGLDQGFTAEFDLVGTRDPSAHLAAPAGLAFLRELGLTEVQAWNHAVAWEGARLLTRRWETDLPLAEPTVGTMAAVPLPDRAGSTAPQGFALRDALLFEDGIEVELHEWRGRLWVRISGQVYTDLGEVERLADRVLARI